MRRRTQGFTLIEIMVVITIIAALVSTVAIIVPKMQENSKKLECQQNLSQLGHVFLMADQENRGKAQKYSGVALWLSYRKNADDIQQGNEKVLLCPGDIIAMPQNDEDRKRWDNVDLDNPPDDLCSYAARDFKNYRLDVESKVKEIIGCDRQGPDQKTMHHKNGIMICFSGGDTQFMGREDLSVPTDSAIVVGPEATNKQYLQKVVYIVRKKD